MYDMSSFNIFKYLMIAKGEDGNDE